MPVYKKIESTKYPTSERVIQTQQKLYLGKDTELTESFRIINVISGSNETKYSGSYFDSLNINFYLSGSKRFRHKFGGEYSKNFKNIQNDMTSFLPISAYKNKFHESSSIISISQKYFGEYIRSGSFTYINSAHPSGTIKIIDDGKGNLYAPDADISKSSATAISSSDNYVGNVSYGLGIAIITETGSFSHSSPSTGSIRLKPAVTSSHFFSITGSDGTSIKFQVSSSFNLTSDTIKYFPSASSLNITATSGAKAINDTFDGEHISASVSASVIKVTNDSNLLKSRKPSKLYSEQDNYPPMSGSYGHITASGFGGGKAPILYTYIGDSGPTTYGASNHYITFDSTISIYTREYICKLNPGEFNVTNNPSALGFSDYEGTIGYVSKSESGLLLPSLTGSEFSPYATQIGLYGESINQEIYPVPLIIGTFTKPIKTNRTVPIIIKLRLDM
jgi:hypothetical protein